MNAIQPFEDVARHGYRLRDWKDRLIPLMRFIPGSANFWTLARGIVLNILNWQMLHGFIPGWFIWVFIAGWLTDFFDGLKARWQKLYGPPPKHTNNRWRIWWRTNSGKYLDPAVDIPTSLFTAYALRVQYTHQELIVWLFVLSIARGLVYGYHAYWAWRRQTDRTIPPNIASQYKTWFLASSFGLLIISQSTDWVTWAEWLFVIGLTLEFLGIISLARACWKKRRTWRREQNNPGSSTNDLIK